MPVFDIDAALTRLEEALPDWDVPVVTFVAQSDGDPFKVLVSCILSLRTLDQTTAEASARLFAEADNPEAMRELGPERIAELIYPVGFYRNKAGQIVELSARLLDDFGGRVPEEIEDLLTFRGVGRKTANLVMVEGFRKPGICVDTHVHRISNRWGYVRTTTPEETEVRLRGKLPDRWWLRINLLLVALGQQICRPLSPRCSECPIADLCRKVKVGRSR